MELFAHTLRSMCDIGAWVLWRCLRASERRGILWRWRGASGHRWVWRNGRGPHLEGRQAPQASSAFRTPTACSQGWLCAHLANKVKPDILKGRRWLPPTIVKG